MLGGYVDVRILPDNSVVATHDLIYTRAILTDMEFDGSYGRRFCFENRYEATIQLDKLKSCDDEPVGYIARR